MKTSALFTTFAAIVGLASASPSVATRQLNLTDPYLIPGLINGSTTIVNTTTIVGNTTATVAGNTTATNGTTVVGNSTILSNASSIVGTNDTLTPTVLKRSGEGLRPWRVPRMRKVGEEVEQKNC